MKIRVVLHIHTDFSYDSNVTPKEIVNQCKKHSINYIGLTDHCTADGGIKYKAQIEKNGIKVITGEEIKTQEGEIIGLFLTKTINCKDKKGNLITLSDAIAQIQKQDALVFAPHPFDLMRLGIGKKNLGKYRDQIDAYEVFNSRTKINIFNKQSEKYAKENNLTAFIGSDAHIAREIPNAIMEMEDFQNKKEFLENLKKNNVEFYKKRFKLIDIIRPTINKFKKKYF